LRDQYPGDGLAGYGIAFAMSIEDPHDLIYLRVIQFILAAQ
jgi:hypothetical protein